MLWERPPLKCLKPRYCTNPGDRMQDLEVPLRGLEMALTNTPSFPVLPSTTFNGDQLKDGLQLMVERNHMINLITGIQNDSSISTVPESTEIDQQTTFLQTIQDNIPQTHKNLPSLFFLFCMKLILPTKTPTKIIDQDQEPNDGSNKKKFSFKEALTDLFPTLKVNNQRLIYAFKSSLSVGLAVFFGLTYSKPDGYWAGLPVAITLSAGRDATFRVANLKAQGTVLGTVYGVLGWFLFENSLPTRLVSLIPWFVFTSFLQRSKMYSQAGGISAVIGAILVLGRKGFGPPSQFAIARIAETFIGLSCSIMVDFLFQPTRASTLSKAHLSRSLENLQNCVNALTFREEVSNLEANRKKLKTCVNELGKFVGEAELEPNFWFLPFPGDCYRKILKSLSKMVDLLDFSARALEFLDHDQEESCPLIQESAASLDGDLELFKELVGSSMKRAQEVTLIKSLADLEKVLEKSKTSYDIEIGKSRRLSLDENEIDKVVSYFVQHSREVVEKIFEGGDNHHDRDRDDDQELIKSQMVLCLSALGFCMSGFMRETREIEVAVKEIVQRENPSSRVNLYEISCMIHALKK